MTGKIGSILKWVGIVFLVLVIISVISGNGDKEDSKRTSNDNVKSATEQTKTEQLQEVQKEESVQESLENQKESKVESEKEFENIGDAFKQGFEDNFKISEENKENLEFIQESVDEISNDEEVKEAYEKWKESVKYLFGGE